MTLLLLLSCFTPYASAWTETLCFVGRTRLADAPASGCRWTRFSTSTRHWGSLSGMTLSPTAKTVVASFVSVVLTVATMLGLAPAPVVCPVCPACPEAVVPSPAPVEVAPVEAAPAPVVSVP